MIPAPAGRLATVERHQATSPVLERVFPARLCDFAWGDMWVETMDPRHRGQAA